MEQNGHPDFSRMALAALFISIESYVRQNQNPDSYCVNPLLFQAL